MLKRATCFLGTAETCNLLSGNGCKVPHACSELPKSATCLLRTAEKCNMLFADAQDGAGVPGPPGRRMHMNGQMPVRTCAADRSPQMPKMAPRPFAHAQLPHPDARPSRCIPMDGQRSTCTPSSPCSAGPYMHMPRGAPHRQSRQASTWTCTSSRRIPGRSQRSPAPARQAPTFTHAKCFLRSAGKCNMLAQNCWKVQHALSELLKRLNATSCPRTSEKCNMLLGRC